MEVEKLKVEVEEILMETLKVIRMDLNIPEENQDILMEVDALKK